MSQTLSKELHAFNDDQHLKEFIVNQVLTHQKADEINNDIFWRDGKGCAVGCITHSDDHGKFEDIGIPEWFAHLIDYIFGGLEIKDAKLFPYKITTAIPVGFSDWQNLYHDYNYYLHDEICVYDKTVKKEIATVKKIHIKRETSEKIWSAARTALHAVEYSSHSATHSSIDSVICSITDSVYSAAESTLLAVKSAPESTRTAKYKKISKKLIKLLEKKQ